MSQDKTLTPFAIALRLLGALGIVVASAALGLLFGKLSTPDLLPGTLVEVPEGAELPPVPDEAGAETPEPAPEVPLEPPPILLQLGIAPDSQWDLLDAEVTYAANIGIHDYMIPAALPWNADSPVAVVEAMSRIATIDPEAEFLVQVNFNPPAEWFDTNPDARMAGTVGDVPYPTPTSETWLAASRAALDRLRSAIADANFASRVSGYALYGLLADSWQRPTGADTSEANTAAFRLWLTRAYNDNDGLRKAWESKDADLATLTVPTIATAEPTANVFYILGSDQALMDYRHFAAESVADAIGALALHLRENAGPEIAIWANYGHTIEKSSAADGHLALTALLESDVDGFISTVSTLNRGIGDTGGFMGPVDSARLHGKRWMLVDDTRTGIAWNKETGQIEQMRGLRAEDVHNVQRRNFAMAAIHGLTLAWSDPNGEGFLHDDAQWEVFGQLYEIYKQFGATPESSSGLTGDVMPVGMGVQVEHPMMQVLVDERSQFLTRPEAGLDPFLALNRDVLLKSGVSANFYLLDDLVDGNLPTSPVYVFLNAYRLPASTVKALHARFAEEKATAIWVYAPGYLDVTMNKNNVRDTVGMEIKKFDEPSPGGSTYTLSGGHWIEQNQVFGESRLFEPLFYIDEPEADVLATFQQTEKPSVAVRTMEAGWTSVFIAEPRLSAPLLREILRILEQPVYFRPGKERFFDTAYIDQRLVAIHAEESGERIVNLGAFYDIVDLFDSSIGWPQKESFVLNFKKGETRLFHLTVP